MCGILGNLNDEFNVTALTPVLYMLDPCNVEGLLQVASSERFSEKGIRRLSEGEPSLTSRGI